MKDEFPIAPEICAKILWIAPEPILIANDHGEFIAVNEAAYELFGTKSQNIIGKQIIDFVHPEDVKETKGLWSDFRQTRFQRGEFKFRSQNGESRILEYAAVADVDPSIHVSFIRDITVKKRLEDAVTESIERELALKEQSFKQVFENSSDLIFRFDSNLNLTYVNPAFSDFLLRSRESLINTSIEDIDLPSRTREEWKLNIRRIFDLKMQDHFEIETLFRGTTHVISCLLVPEISLDGSVSTVTGIARDLTTELSLEAERLRIEGQTRALRSSEELFQQLAESLPHIVWTLTPDGHLSYLNQKWLEYTGRPFDQKDESIWREFFHPDDHPQIFKINEARVRGEPITSEFRIKGRDKIYRWHLSRMTPIKDAEGNITRWVGTATNIDQQKKAQRAAEIAEEGATYMAQVSVLLSSSLEYRKTLNSIAQLLVPHLADWCVIDVYEPGSEYPVTVALHHTDPERLKWAQEMRRKYPPDWNASSGPARVIKTGKSELYPEITDEMLIHDAKSKEELAMFRGVGFRSVMIVPILGNANQPLGTMSLITAEMKRNYTDSDVVIAEELGRRAGLAIERARLFESEKQARREAENANKSKSIFLANMSHEMRTPLNALIGFNDVLRNSDLTSQQREHYHDIIARNGELLLRLIDDILDLSKVESGHLALERIPVSLPDLISEVTSSFQPRAEEKGLAFNVRFEGHIPETVLTDPTRLKQILNNLIGNAIKFTSEGRVEVVVAKNWEQRRLHFEVIDTGPGIAPEALPRLFQPFSQADASMTRKFGGTGLGLSLSKRLANSLGGDVWFDQTWNQPGSRFIAEIEGSVPLAKQQALFSQRNVAPSGPNVSNLLFGKRILIVEDSPDNQLLFERYLVTQGASVEAAENGLIGVKRALNGNFDAVLMDIQMPVLDGYAATKTLRSKGYKGPIIALTAHAMEQDRNRCVEVGCTDYLTKPVKASALIDIIRKYTDGNPHPSGRQ